MPPPVLVFVPAYCDMEKWSRVLVKVRSVNPRCQLDCMGLLAGPRASRMTINTCSIS